MVLLLAKKEYHDNECDHCVDKTNDAVADCYRVLEGPRGQLTEHVSPAAVCDAAARTGIESKGQIKPALLGLDVGDIALPELARGIRRQSG
jgi:hypothetical protein